MTDYDIDTPDPANDCTTDSLRGPTRSQIHIPGETLGSILSKPSRRNILEHLAEENAALSIETLAAAIADTQIGDAGTETLRNVMIRLTHCDLPMLAETGLLEYDPDRDTVSPTRSTFLVASTTRWDPIGHPSI